MDKGQADAQQHQAAVIGLPYLWLLLCFALPSSRPRVT